MIASGVVYNNAKDRKKRIDHTSQEILLNLALLFKKTL